MEGIMTKAELRKAMELCGVTLPSTGETGFIDLSKTVNYIVLIKFENKYFKYGEYLVKFDMTNEILKVFTVKKENNKKFILCYPGTETECVDAYLFSSIMTIVPNTKGE